MKFIDDLVCKLIYILVAISVDLSSVIISVVQVLIQFITTKNMTMFIHQHYFAWLTELWCVFICQHYLEHWERGSRLRSQGCVICAIHWGVNGLPLTGGPSRYWPSPTVLGFRERSGLASCILVRSNIEVSHSKIHFCTKWIST